MKVSKKFFNLKKGNKNKINNKIYTKKEKTTHPAPNKYESKYICYNLGNDYSLEYDFDWNFLKLETKKGFFGFETTRSKNIKIEDIFVL